jgi:hypothetical protein
VVRREDSLGKLETLLPLICTREKLLIGR